jgi:hypothetical protein
VSQDQEQQEDSAMILDSTQHHRRENIEKHTKGKKQKTKNKRGHTIGRKEQKRIEKKGPSGL